MLPSFPGCDITALVVKHGERGQYSADTTGFDLFEQILLQLQQYPDLAQDSPIQELLKDVEAQGADRAESFKAKLNVAHKLAVLIVQLAKLGCIRFGFVPFVCRSVLRSCGV